MIQTQELIMIQIQKLIMIQIQKLIMTLRVEHTMTYDPDSGAYYDPDSGAYYDPETQASYNPETGDYYDPVTGAYYNSETGDYYDPMTGAYYDSATGEYFDPNAKEDQSQKSYEKRNSAADKKKQKSKKEDQRKEHRKKHKHKVRTVHHLVTPLHQPSPHKDIIVYPSSYPEYVACCLASDQKKKSNSYKVTTTAQECSHPSYRVSMGTSMRSMTVVPMRSLTEQAVNRSSSCLRKPQHRERYEVIPAVQYYCSQPQITSYKVTEKKKSPPCCVSGPVRLQSGKHVNIKVRENSNYVCDHTRVLAIGEPKIVEIKEQTATKPEHEGTMTVVNSHTHKALSPAIPISKLTAQSAPCHYHVYKNDGCLAAKYTDDTPLANPFDMACIQQGVSPTEFIKKPQITTPMQMRVERLSNSKPRVFRTFRSKARSRRSSCHVETQRPKPIMHSSEECVVHACQPCGCQDDNTPTVYEVEKEDSNASDCCRNENHCTEERMCVVTPVNCDSGPMCCSGCTDMEESVPQMKRFQAAVVHCIEPPMEKALLNKSEGGCLGRSDSEFSKTLEQLRGSNLDLIEERKRRVVQLPLQEQNKLIKRELAGLFKKLYDFTSVAPNKEPPDELILEMAKQVKQFSDQRHAVATLRENSSRTSLDRTAAQRSNSLGFCNSSALHMQGLDALQLEETQFVASLLDDMAGQVQRHVAEITDELYLIESLGQILLKKGAEAFKQAAEKEYQSIEEYWTHLKKIQSVLLKFTEEVFQRRKNIERVCRQIQTMKARPPNKRQTLPYCGCRPRIDLLESDNSFLLERYREMSDGLQILRERLLEAEMENTYLRDQATNHQINANCGLLYDSKRVDNATKEKELEEKVLIMKNQLNFQNLRKHHKSPRTSELTTSRWDAYCRIGEKDTDLRTKSGAGGRKRQEAAESDYKRNNKTKEFDHVHSYEASTHESLCSDGDLTETLNKYEELLSTFTEVYEKVKKVQSPELTSEQRESLNMLKHAIFKLQCAIQDILDAIYKNKEVIEGSTENMREI